MNGIRLNGKKRVVVRILSLLALALLALRIGFDYIDDTALHFVTELLPALAVVLFAGVFCAKPKMRWWGSLCFLLPLLRELVVIGTWQGFYSDYDYDRYYNYDFYEWMYDSYIRERSLRFPHEEYLYAPAIVVQLLVVATVVLLLVIGIQSFKRRPTGALAWVALGTVALTTVFCFSDSSAVFSWVAELLWVVCLLLMLPKWLSAGAAEKKLNKLNAARDAGKLTEADYAARRAKIIEML